MGAAIPGVKFFRSGAVWAHFWAICGEGVGSFSGTAGGSQKQYPSNYFAKVLAFRLTVSQNDRWDEIQ